MPAVFDGSSLNIMGYSAVKGSDNGASSTPQVAAVVAPSVSFSVSSPNMLSRDFRKGTAIVLWLLTAAALVVSAVVATTVDGAAGATAAVSLMILAITTITLSYFVIMGFGKVEYSAGLQGAAKEKETEEDADKDKDKGEDGKTGSKPGEPDKDADSAADELVEPEKPAKSG